MDRQLLHQKIIRKLSNKNRKTGVSFWHFNSRFALKTTETPVLMFSLHFIQQLTIRNWHSRKTLLMFPTFFSQLFNNYFLIFLSWRRISNKKLLNNRLKKVRDIIDGLKITGLHTQVQVKNFWFLGWRMKLPHGAPPAPSWSPRPPIQGLPLKIRSGAPAYLLWLISRGASNVFDCDKNLWTQGAPPWSPHGAPPGGLPLKIRSDTPAYLLWLISNHGAPWGGPWGSQIFTKTQKCLRATLETVRSHFHKSYVTNNALATSSANLRTKSS